MQIGDLVLARNEKTGEQAFKPVEVIYENETQELAVISVGGIEVVTTPLHPFWVRDKGWVNAKNLNIGDGLELSDGSYVPVANVELRQESKKVYNISVRMELLNCSSRNSDIERKIDMIVYLLWHKEAFMTLKNLGDMRPYRGKFNGKPISQEWIPLQIEELDKNAKIYDYCKMANIPILSEKAVHTLRDFLEGKVEILPCEHDTGTYYAINIINVIDCIDYEKADIDQTKVVPEITKYAFIQSLLEGEKIFKIPQYKVTKIYVTDEFRKRVLESNLTGFEFIELWDSEAPDVEDAVNPLVFEGPAYTYKEAMKLVEQGKTLASDRWVLQLHKNEVYLGTFLRNGTFSWDIPLFFPPVLFDMKWYIVDRMEITEEV